MQSFPTSLCYLNGEYAPLRRGQGLGARPRLHLRRRRLRGRAGLRQASCSASTSTWRGSAAASAKLRIANPHEPRPVARALPEADRRVAERGGATDQLVYIQVTRGVALRDHVMPAGIEPTVFMMASAMKPATGEQRHHGVACVTARDFRWERGDIKSISLLGNVLARQMSADHGALETIMFRDGYPDRGVGAQRLGRPRRRAARPAEERARAGRHPLRAAPRAVRGVGIAYNLRPIPEADVAGGRRDAAQLGDQGGAAGDDARRRSRRPRRAARQARAGVRAGCTRRTSAPRRRSRSEPGRAGGGLKPSPAAPKWRDGHHHARHPCRAVADRVPVALSDQGDGRQRRRLRRTP